MNREEAIDILRSYLMFDKSNMQIDMALNMAIEALKKEAERQEMIIRASERYLGIVRCKDCKWWNGNPETMHNNHLCRNWSKFGSINTSADDFCSCGERKEVDG